MVSIVEQNKGRNTYIDIIKGFAIILVVLGHSIQFGSGYDFRANAECFNNWLYRIIYSFHMPLFMIGGVFGGNYNIKEKPVDCYKIKDKVVGRPGYCLVNCI